MPNHGPNVWVVRDGDDYSITEEGTRRHLVPPITQRLAIDIARLMARANRSEVIVAEQARAHPLSRQPRL